MSERNTVVRSLHDVGMAAWFGGSLMGATGLNGATSEANDPTERIRLSSLGWAKWTPWQLLAVGAHTVGGIGLMVANKNRVNKQPGAKSLTVVKLLLTGVAAGTTAYSGVLGAKLKKHESEGASGATEPRPGASDEVAAVQKQLKLLQWAIPVVTGVLIVLGAVEGEQQRGAAGLLDLGTGGVKRALAHTLKSAS